MKDLLLECCLSWNGSRVEESTKKCEDDETSAAEQDTDPGCVALLISKHNVQKRPYHQACRFPGR